jgi:hypothetical protein
MTRRGTILDQEASQMVQQDHSVTLEEVQVGKEKLKKGTTKEEEKITEATWRSTDQIARRDKEEEEVEKKAVLSRWRAVSDVNLLTMREWTAQGSVPMMGLDVDTVATYTEQTSVQYMWEMQENFKSERQCKLISEYAKCRNRP